MLDLADKPREVGTKIKPFSIKQGKNAGDVGHARYAQTTSCQLAAKGLAGSQCILNPLISANTLTEGGIHGAGNFARPIPIVLLTPINVISPVTLLARTLDESISNTTISLSGSLLLLTRIKRAR